MNASWRTRAACRSEDPELFFPIGTTGPALVQIEEAKRVCARCPVREDCLAEALDAGDKDGIFGGMTPAERARQRRRNRRAVARRRVQEVKECACCHLTLPVAKFYKRPEREGGRDAYCRPCCAKRARERRAAKKKVPA